MADIREKKEGNSAIDGNMRGSRPFGWRDKWGYLFGDLGNNFSFVFASSYLMVFYTKVLGLSGSVVGTLFLLARIVDAFTDVTMGQIVDRARPSQDGRFRPWIRRMCVPMAIISTLMYMYFVRDWSYTAKLTYVSVTYVLWSSFCYTALNIPYGSMASVISADAGDRASLSTYRSMGASLAGLVIGVLVPLIVYDTDVAGNQVVLPERFTLTAIVFGILSVVCYLICYWWCTERVTFESKGSGKAMRQCDKEIMREQNRKDSTGEKVTVASNVTSKKDRMDQAKTGENDGIGAMLLSLAKNRPLISTVASALVLLLANLLGQTMNNYLFLDYFRNTKALIALNIIMVVGMLVIAPFISKIVVRFGKKEAGAAGMLLAGVVYLLLFVLRVKSIPLFLVILFVAMIGAGLFNMITWAFITDIIDYQEVETGKREDGTVYAVYSVARKLGQALAGGVGGFALTAIGYVSEATSQTPEVAERVYTVATLIPGVCYLLVFLIIQFWYPLTRDKVKKNTEILKERRNSSVAE